MQTTINNAAKTIFQGYKARMGEKVVFVVNSGFSTDGNRTPALKVKIGRYIGCTGWSGGAYPQYAFDGREMWVKASAVTR